MPRQNRSGAVELVAALVQPAILLDARGSRIRVANPAFCDAVGLTPAALVGQPLASLLHEADGKKIGVDERPIRFRRPDEASIVLTPSHSTPVANGRLVIFHPVVTENSAEPNLLAWIREALDGVMHYIAIFDRNDRLIACNKYYRSTFAAGDRHLPPEIEIEGKTYRELMEFRVKYKLHHELVEDPTAFIEERMRRFYHDGDSRVRLANGRTIRAQYRRLRDGGRVLVSTDITEIVAAEAVRRELEAQLHHSQKLEALGTLAGGLAHDLNNTLVPILALSKFTARHLPEGSAERRNLETIQKSGERAKDLVSRILTFSRKETVRLQELNLADVLPEALEMLRALIPSTIDIQRRITPVPSLRSDAGQWHQVMTNLLTNAAHAMGFRPGLITVELYQQDEAIILSVRDTGIGMDEATRRRALEPFFTTRGVGEGTGLGLSVVHGIITAHGGSIDLESAPGAGTCVKITLPLPAAASGAAKVPALL